MRRCAWGRESVLGIWLSLPIALLLAAVAGSVVLWVRSGETRAGLYGAAFFAVAAQLGVWMWTTWGAPFDLGAPLLALVATIAAGILSVFVVVAAWRTLAERDHMEALHWDSMEAVRELNELETAKPSGLDERMGALLEIGVAHFGLEFGLCTRGDGKQQTIVAVSTTESMSLHPGDVLTAGALFCDLLEAERPLGIESAAESHYGDCDERPLLGFDAYLGVAVPVNGRPDGILSFFSRRPRSKRFNATDKDLASLVAQRLGVEFERAESSRRQPETAILPALHVPGADVLETGLAATLGTAPRFGPRRPRARRPARKPRPPRTQHEVDINSALASLERELRSLAGPRIEIAFDLDATLAPAAIHRAPLDAIARTLVLTARDVTPAGGRLELCTGGLDRARSQHDRRSSSTNGSEASFVTLTVRSTGELDGDALERLFSSPIEVDEDTSSDPDGRLALATVQRVLHRCGGDLSVGIEPGIGTTFTVFVPRAQPRAAAGPQSKPRTRFPGGAGPTAH